ncbi:MAG: transketolase [Bacteroidales bacterium]|nr:transketolase [Bacteroidales bacterium]
MSSIEELSKISLQVRRDIIRMVSSATCGHPGGSLSSTDILTALYFAVMEHSPSEWKTTAEGQDAFVLSAGHLAPVYYSVLARSGYFPVSELGTLRKTGSRLQGHPSVADGLPGILLPSGSLGQGVSAAAGIALGKRLSGDPHKVYCLCGDGESEEGQIWEAGMFAAHHKIDNLIAFTDVNGFQIDGATESVTALADLREKWLSFGWEVIEADGHDFASILNAFKLAGSANGKPKMILFHTHMGQGVDFMTDRCEWHGKAPDARQCQDALSQLEETLGDY